MIEINLSNGEKCLIDDVDSDLSIYSRRKLNDYASCRHKGKCIYLHRVIADRISNRKIGRLEIVDHIDHNTLDNRRSNLRIVTPGESLVNRKKMKNKKSKYIGVSKSSESSRNKPWRAYIGINKKHISLGYFETEEEAARQRDIVAKKIYGDIARLNNV